MPELVMTIETIFIFQDNNGYSLALNETTGELWIPIETPHPNNTINESQWNSSSTILGELLDNEKRIAFKIKIECVRKSYTSNGNTWDFIGMSEHYVAYRCRNFICYFNYKKEDMLQPNSYWTNVWSTINNPTANPKYMAKEYANCFIVPCINQDNPSLLSDKFFNATKRSINQFSDAYFLLQPAPLHEKLSLMKEIINESIKCFSQKHTSGLAFFSTSTGCAFIPALLQKINHAHHILELFHILYDAIAEPFISAEYKSILESLYESVSSKINLFETKSWLILHTAIPEFMRRNIDNCKSIDEIITALSIIRESHPNLVKILSALSKIKASRSYLQSSRSMS